MMAPLLPHLRRCIGYAKYGAGAAFAASMTTAWYYRPVADRSSSATTNANDDDESGLGLGVGHHHHHHHHADSRRKADDEFFCAPYTSPPWSRERVPILLEWARRISIGATTLAIRLLMNTYGNYQIRDDEHYRNFLHAVVSGVDGRRTETEGGGGGGQQNHRGTITVSNHRSLFDDPGVVSCLLPLPLAVQPKYNRWALCSQEYCFNDALPGLVKGYIGAGQVLPICRGGGIDHRLLLDFARHLACGEWCHIFPEGGVWQWEELGGRRELPENATVGSSSDFGNSPSSNDDRVLGEEGASTTSIVVPGTLEQKSLPYSPAGKLKWGVGKLIAHAPVTPRVIPFAHRGMERLLPQDERTGKTRLRDDLLPSLLPAAFFGGDGDAPGGPRVRIKFGGEIAFDDLIDEHESRHGRLWKFCGKLDAEEQYDRGEEHAAESHHRQRWSSSREERVLYSRIVRRIETRLDAITREVCDDEDEDR